MVIPIGTAWRRNAGVQQMTASILIFAAAVVIVSFWVLGIHSWISNECAETEHLDALTKAARSGSAR